MSSIATALHNNQLTITPQSDFDYRAIDAFVEAYQSQTDAHSYTIDLRQVNHLDSSTLGMLLLMRKTIQDTTPINITNANASVKKILIMSRFDKKFNIE